MILNSFEPVGLEDVGRILVKVINKYAQPMPVLAYKRGGLAELGRVINISLSEE